MKFFNNPVIYKHIKLKLNMETNFGLLSSKTSIKLQFDISYDVMVTFSTFVDETLV